MQLTRLVVLLSVALFLSSPSFSQGDVRSATGMPIPIGTAVIWGQIELKGLKPGEPKPTIYVTLLFNGAQIGRSLANDKGYYYFTQRARDGATLLVTVGGIDAGSQNLTAAGGDRYDMTVNWDSSLAREPQSGVISVRDAYPDRSPANTALMTQASELVKARKTAKAVRLYEQIVADDPKDFVAWTEIGSLHFSSEKYADAEKAYRKAVELEPDFALALVNLGKLYFAEKRFADATLVLENAVMADRTNADALYFLGESYLQTKQGSKAVGVLNEALRLQPNEKADIHLRLAALYNGAGMKDRAANEYKLFLQKRPDYKEKAKLEAYIKENSK